MEPSESKSAVELLRLTRRCRGIDKYVSSSAGLTIDEMHCLTALYCERPSSVKRLYELINVSPSRASKLLKHLEERDLVSRSISSADHRQEQVILTERGRKTVQAILSLFAEVGSELLGSWRAEVAADFSWLERTFTRTEQTNAKTRPPT